jgi:hypothetical protein
MEYGIASVAATSARSAFENGDRRRVPLDENYIRLPGRSGRRRINNPGLGLSHNIDALSRRRGDPSSGCIRKEKVIVRPLL